MRSGSGGATLRRVTDTPSPLVLRLELTSPIDPIAGSVSGPGVEPVAFSGWTGLASALGRVVEASTRSDSPEVSPQ